MKKSVLLCLFAAILLLSASCAKQETHDPERVQQLHAIPLAMGEAVTTPAPEDADEPEIIPTDDTERFSELADKSASHRDYPILGCYLEQTDETVRLYFDASGKLIGAAALRSGALSRPFELSDPFGNDACFRLTERLLSAYPDFEILGYVYDSLGYPDIYPVGKNGETDHLQFVAGEPTDFRLVKPFGSIEEGRAAFAAYFKRQ